MAATDGRRATSSKPMRENTLKAKIAAGEPSSLRGALQPSALPARCTFDYCRQPVGRERKCARSRLHLVCSSLLPPSRWRSGPHVCSRPFPRPGLGVTLALIGWGATLAAHGMAGHAITKRNPATAYSWRAVFYLLLALTLAATMPLVVDVLNLATVAGLPVGYYMAAQGLLILMAIFWRFAPPHTLMLSATPPPPRNRARITEC